MCGRLYGTGAACPLGAQLMTSRAAKDWAAAAVAADVKGVEAGAPAEEEGDGARSAGQRGVGFAGRWPGGRRFSAGHVERVAAGGLDADARFRPGPQSPLDRVAPELDGRPGPAAWSSAAWASVGLHTSHE